MFEQTLEDKFKAIFGVKKVTYAEPGDSQEQEVLFINVEDPKFRFPDKRAVATVTGQAVMFGRNDALTFGFFAKCIAKAPHSLTKDLFFENLDSNTKRFGDIVQRGFSFTFFFNSQHDPDVGTITIITTSVEEES